MIIFSSMNITYSNEPNSPQLPRPDLREHAFRKYEHLISKACFGSFNFDPTDINNILRPMTAHTFACRFRDAILGFRRFGYISRIIPKDYDVNLIKVYELQDGTVFIKNESADALASTTIRASDHKRILEILAGKELTTGKYYGLEFFITYTNDAERDWVMQQSGTSAQDLPEKKQISLL